jgi:hypothetical protein
MSFLPQPGLGSAVIGAVLTASAPSYAAQIEVPASLPTIQEAISAASSGDEIIVAPGTYSEQLDFLDKTITLRSQTGPAETILDGGQDGTIIEMDISQGRDTVVQGFTFRNAVNGAIWMNGASATIVDNVFERNAGYHGVALTANGGAPLIARNIFRNHLRRPDSSLPCKSVLNLANYSDVVFVNNVVANNDCVGLEMFVAGDNTPLIANNTFVRNQTGLRFMSAYTAQFQVVRSNIFYGNAEGVTWFPLTRDPVPPQWRYNLFYGNGIDYKAGANLTGVDGNISADPLLRGLDIEDYNPDSDSPVVDAGEGDSGGFETDFYLRPRLHDADGDGASVIDIGVAELHAPTPTVDLALTPSQVPLGEPTTLSWSSANADGCEARGGAWSGSRPPTGTEEWSSNVAHRPVFQLVCAGDGVRRAKSVELIVGDVFPVELSITPDAIADDQTTTITWAAPSASVCQASGAWSGEIPPSGSRTIPPPVSRGIVAIYVHGIHTFNLDCSSATGTGRAAPVTLSVQERVLMHTGPSPSPITLGETATLSWTSTGAVVCRATNGTWTSGDLPTEGPLEVTPTFAGFNIYKVTCWGSTGSTAYGEYVFNVLAPESDDPDSSGGGGRIPWDFALVLMLALARRRISSSRARLCK